MDGNGRWAKQRHMPRLFGHRAGMESVREAVRGCSKIGVQYLTLYAFSSENWTRPTLEIRGLMQLLQQYLKKELAELHANGVQLRTIGRTEALPQGAQRELAKAIAATANNKGLVLNLALNYGGRQEIVDACNRLLKEGRRTIDEKEFAKHLYTADCPDPDLLIRTSGEMRISNYLLWQMAYTEFYMTPVCWPDFRQPHLLDAIADYQSRQRRFGGL
jgi:undecaprenyl diphosphate synthase